MQRRPLNISAALAIAIERQVEDIIANAKAQCALHYRATLRRGFPDPPSRTRRRAAVRVEVAGVGRPSRPADARTPSRHLEALAFSVDASAVSHLNAFAERAERRSPCRNPRIPRRGGFGRSLAATPAPRIVADRPGAHPFDYAEIDGDRVAGQRTRVHRLERHRCRRCTRSRSGSASECVYSVSLYPPPRSANLKGPPASATPTPPTSSQKIRVGSIISSGSSRLIPRQTEATLQPRKPSPCGSFDMSTQAARFSSLA